MRAAAEMQRQQTQHGAGRGMMGIVLPMYAVGIVLYLVYTLVKVTSVVTVVKCCDSSYGSRSYLLLEDVFEECEARNCL